VTTALSLSLLYSPVAAVKVVLPEGSSTLTATHAASPARPEREGGRASRDYKFHLSAPMSVFDVDVDNDIETGMNLAALQYDLKLCREHGTYIDLKTLAFAIHHVLQDDTDVLVKHLFAYATGKRE
jgi:hypothetical protein